MKVVILFFFLTISLNVSAQRSLARVKYSKINELKSSDYMGQFTAIATTPDSVSMEGKKYIMYFFKNNLKTKVNEKFYKTYTVLAKHADKMRIAQEENYRTQRNRNLQNSNRY